MTTLSEILELAKAARERAEKATLGPWKYEGWSGSPQKITALDGHTTIVHSCLCCIEDDDFRFIAAARTDVPQLCKAVEVLVKALKLANTDWTRATKLNGEPNDWIVMVLAGEQNANA